jgi:hypothetical protein
MVSPFLAEGGACMDTPALSAKAETVKKRAMIMVSVVETVLCIGTPWMEYIFYILAGWPLLSRHISLFVREQDPFVVKNQVI